MNLHIGTTVEGKPFTLPADLGDKKIAVLAQSKKGKTYGLGDILEELYKAQRPFIATDPANNFWGLRSTPLGTPSDYDVVVIGGDHADIPFDEKAGERMADVLLGEPICAVIDLAFESGGAQKRFMTNFAGRLMQTKPEIPRVIVLEECPVLIPQHAVGAQAQMCKAAVSKLATIGGNFGYGVIPACQRPATMDKDVLSQCEALIVMGITHRKDRQTIREWMEAKDIGERAAVAFAELGSLKPGEAWYWNPGEDRFEKFTFRERETLHPREMQKLGLKAGAVQLGDARRFVERVKGELARTVAAVPGESKIVRSAKAIAEMAKNPELKKVLVEANAGVRKALGEASAREKDHRDEIGKLAIENGQLRTAKANLEGQLENFKAELKQERAKTAQMALRLNSVKKQLQPQYDSLRGLFEEIGEAAPSVAGAVDRAPYELLLVKARQRGCGKMLEALFDRPELTKNQLGIIAGVPAQKSTFRAYMAWLKRAGLVEVDGDMVRLRSV